MKTTAAPKAAPAPDEPRPPADYLDLYGLSRPPFGGRPENTGYILFGPHRRACELLVRHVVNGSGIILLHGEEGIGKTEALRIVASIAAESSVRTIMVSRPPNGRTSLMQLVSALQGQPAASETTGEEAITHFLAPPRKALLADDVDLMPEECVRLILTLAGRIKNDPGDQAIVLSTSTDLSNSSQQPVLGELAALASDTVRLLPLGPAEIRQYIERSLWIAGGTTRRLIASGAMKLLIARSGGKPGMTNRLMEAALTAGFARGDPIITAKTVAAAMGPSAPRPRRPVLETSGTAATTIQIVAIGLLALGVSAFLYRGLNGKLEPEATVPSKPAKIATPPPTEAPPGRVFLNLPPELMTALMKRGEQSLSLGDISAARLAYQRAAESGNGAAAMALGKTYDPSFVAVGSKPDPARAAEWYQKAITLGEPRAVDLLQHLVR